jgi:hypothetical protein
MRDSSKRWHFLTFSSFWKKKIKKRKCLSRLEKVGKEAGNGWGRGWKILNSHLLTDKRA